MWLSHLLTLKCAILIELQFYIFKHMVLAIQDRNKVSANQNTAYINGPGSKALSDFFLLFVCFVLLSLEPQCPPDFLTFKTVLTLVIHLNYKAGKCIHLVKENYPKLLFP